MDQSLTQSILCGSHANPAIYDHQLEKFVCLQCISDNSQDRFTYPTNINKEFFIKLLKLDWFQEKQVLSLTDDKMIEDYNNFFIQLEQEIQNTKQSIFESLSLKQLKDNIGERQELFNSLSTQIKYQSGRNSQNQIINDEDKQKILQSIKTFDEIVSNFVSSSRNQLYDLQSTFSNLKAKLEEKILGYAKIPFTFKENKNVTSSVNDQGVKEYKIQGLYYLFSEETISVDTKRKYILNMDVKNCSNQRTYTGFKSFRGKDPIFDWQALVKEGTQVKLIGIDEQNKAFIVDNINNNLQKWNPVNSSYHLKYIGYYKSGDINDFIKSENVLNIDAYKEINLQESKIYLTDKGWDLFKQKQLFEEGDLGKIFLMNHQGGGTYDYTEVINSHIPEWTKKTYYIRNFRKFTDQLQVCFLGNYGGTEDKVFEFRNVSIQLCPQES